MELGLAGKVALVTGGSRGIGAGIVAGLAREGCSVAFTHFGDGGNAEALVGDRVAAHEADAASYRDAERVVAGVVSWAGGLDILVCNAGITADGVVWKLGEDDWDRVLDVNLKGCFNYAHAAAPQLRARGGGRVVNVASINGLRGKFGQANYAASKGGMIALTKTLARELGRFSITANAVAPGMVRTEMVEDLPAGSVDAAIKESVLERIAEIGDIADAVLFLCSARAAHITGECLRVDGGQFMG